VGGLVHPYLAVMTMALLGAAAAGARAAWPLRARSMAAALTATVAGWWLSGLFSGADVESLATEGLGHYSMNLLSPISPTGGWSRLLPEWPRATTGQDYEGFQYLGLGLLALTAAAVRIRWTTPGADTQTRPAFGALVLVAVAMAIFALSPRVTLGRAVLMDLSGPVADRFAVFRATGRFFWPMGYLLVIGVVSTVVTRARPQTALLLLGAAAALQMVDLNGAHLERRRNAHDPAFHAWNQIMVSAAWTAALPHYDHLVLYPPPQCGPSPVPYEPAAYLAGIHGLTINAGGVARPDESARTAYCHDLGDAVKAGRVDARSFYVMMPSQVAALRAVAAPPVVCGVIDALSVCVTAQSYQRWRDAAQLD
jgi:hypothetical protein